MSNDPLDMMIGVESAKRDAEAALTHAQAAREAEERGEHELVLEEYSKAVAADPTNAAVMFRFAFLLDMAGQDDEAIALYERVCEFKPAPINVATAADMFDPTSIVTTTARIAIAIHARSCRTGALSRTSDTR